MKDFRSVILISYLYIYSYKRLIFLWQIVIEKYHLTSTSWVGPGSELIEVNSCTELILRWCLKCMKFWMFQLYLYLLYFWDVGFALACKLINYSTKRVNIVKFAENFLLLTPLGTRPPHQKFRTRINIHCKDKVANRY